MSFATSLCAALKGNAGVSAIVGTKVYREVTSPGNAVSAPYIDVGIDGGRGHNRHFAGVGRLMHSFGVIRCVELTAISADALAARVRLALDGFIGSIDGLLGNGANTCDVRRISLDGPYDILIGPTDGSSEGIHARVFDFEAWYNEV
jgi:hypothetical protein